MSELSAAQEEAHIPDSGVIGGFDIRAVLMSGGMTTFLRVQDGEGKFFCMKVPTRDGARDHTLRSRFHREVQILNQLSGPAFPVLHACGTYSTKDMDGIPYIVTDLPRGETLDKILEDRKANGAKLDAAGAVRLLRRLAQALAQAHGLGFVHRYLKPQKVAVGPDGEVEVLDFVLGLGASVRSITPANVFLGAPSYVAPEQAKDPHNVDGRADLYSLGMIMYEYLTQQHPFHGAPLEVAEVVKHFTILVQPPSKLNPDIPPGLDAIVMKLIQREPGQRYASAHALLEDLDRLFPE